MSNVSCTTIVHTLFNQADVKMIFTTIVHFFFHFHKKKKMKIICISVLLYKVYTIVVQETLLAINIQ
jgi:hypothetical protein